MNGALVTLAISVGFSLVVIPIGLMRTDPPSVELEAALQGAAAIVHDRKHGSMLPEHFLIAAMTDDQVASSMRRRDVSALAVIDTCVQRLDAIAALPDVAQVTLAEPIGRALQAAARDARGTGSIPLASVLDHLVALTPELLPNVALEPEAPPASSGYRERGDTHHIVFWNNPVTRMDDVIQMLTGMLGIDRTRAVCQTFRVHCVGAASVGVWPIRDAMELAERVRAFSAELGRPVDVTTAAAFEPPRPSLGAKLRRRLRYARFLG